MAVTAQDIFDAAVARSSLDAAALLPTQQVLRWISLLQRKVYLQVARLDPGYFGKSGTTSARTQFTDSWDVRATPGDIAALTSATVAAIVGTPPAGVTVGATVNLIDLRAPYLHVAPRAYVRGGKIYAYNNELGSADANMATQLQLEYAELPPLVNSMTDQLRIPDEWSPLVENRLARLFSVRDQRLGEEVGALDSEYAELLGVMNDAVLVFSQGVTRALPSVPSLPISFGPPQGG